MIRIRPPAAQVMKDGKIKCKSHENGTRTAEKKIECGEKRS